MPVAKLKALLLIISVLCVASALLTLLPYSSSRTNDFGYHSLCPFAPWSTLTLLLTVGAAMAIRNYISTRAD